MLTAIQNENNISFMPHDTSALIQEHLQGLEANLKEYFPPINSNKAWIRNPFSINIETTFPDLNVESLIELSCDTALKDIYKERPLIDIWLSCHQEYPVVAEQAITFLMPFVTTYKCEAGFSTLVFLKNKYRNQLEVEPDLGIKLTSFPANLEFLVKNKPLHTSH
ncbi:zinc finger BED domain-containing protein 5-like [Acyrthosiphon pisum]|uniref:SCAN domain-containing protein 3 n=1 Tax=Acyrthosiphon pisum TaxID=7029 RepID=A0A8R2B7K0_ACYPI|nr:zinc finger BED domain-containing protein 5-like [Acyrthosiphon pisum]|eukprot:XP_008185177.1 PREDICTED: zinc finger BED domain-containing protein 5-like [Acyrthosiphon pisum]